MNREIYQNQYDAEMERKISLSSAVNTPIVALTIIGAALSAMILKFSYTYSQPTYIFLIFMAFSIFFSGYSIYLIFRSLIGHSHGKIAPCSELKNYHLNLIEFHQSQVDSAQEANSLAQKDFDDYFNDRLSEASDLNSENNIKRGGFIHEATVGIAKSLLFLALSAPIFLHNTFINQSSIHRVELVNPIVFKNEVNKMTKKDSKGSSDVKSSKPESSQKPAGPPITIFKDNSNKSSDKKK